MYNNYVKDNKIPFIRRYCGIMIVHGGLMLVDFEGYPFPQIYIPMNV